MPIIETIGGVLAEDRQVKRWPKKTIVVSSIISAYMLYFAMVHSSYITLLFVVIYWGVFFVCMAYSFSRNRTYKFGALGVLREYKKGSVVEKTISLYADVDKPDFHVTEFKVNGMHTNYAFSVNFGTIGFAYSFAPANIPYNDFDYICAHKFYRYWSKSKFGEESNFNESERIALGEIANMLK